MDWMYAIKSIAYLYLFIACLALYVYIYKKRRGRNYGKPLLQVVLVTYATGIGIGVIGGVIFYALSIILERGVM